jgi:trehalose-6-phosphate synthase
MIAFEELLDKNPDLRDKVVFIQIAAPSRTGVAEYQRLRREIDELVGRVSGRFSSPSGSPLVYIHQNLPRERLVPLYRLADVALVTPLRDGMNLVCLEYIAARGEEPGALILSEFTGAAQCLSGAVLVNPYNTSEVASALADALRGEEAAHGVRVTTVYPGRTASPMQAKVHQQEGKEYDAERWIAPETVATTVLTALDLPRDAEITDLQVRPRG